MCFLRRVLWVCLGACALGAAALGGELDTSRRWAVIIGIDAYDDPKMADLAFAVADAKLVAATLQASGGWEADHIVLLTSDAENPSLRPTKGNILEQLELLRRNFASTEDVFFFFSGHGVSTDEGVPEVYLLPIDGKRLVPEETGLAMGALLAALEDVARERRFVVVDACRNRIEEGGKGIVQAWRDPRYRTSRGTRILYSAADGQVSYEDPALGHGVFSHVFVRGLEGAADGFEGAAPRDGIVSAEELYRWLALELPKESMRRSQVQSPGQGGAWTGLDFAVVEVPDWAAPESVVATLPRRRRAWPALLASGAGLLVGGALVGGGVLVEHEARMDSWAFDLAPGEIEGRQRNANLLYGAGYAAGAVGVGAGVLLGPVFKISW